MSSIIIKLTNKFNGDETTLSEVNFLFAPVHELFCSIRAFVDKAFRTTTDLGPSWHKRVRSEISATLRSELESTTRRKLLTSGFHVPLLLACPSLESTTASLDWLGQVSLAEMAAAFVQYGTLGTQHIDGEMVEKRDSIVRLMRAWDTAYFKNVDVTVLRHLEQDAASRAAHSRQMPVDDTVFAAMKGVYLPMDQIDNLILIPQHHLAPWNFSYKFGSTYVAYYSCGFVPSITDDDSPPPDLLRLTRTLADESRLRMLKYIAGSRRSFTDVLNQMPLSKGTVHHHLVALRAAGLLTVRQDISGAHALYELSEGALDRVHEALSSYLGG